MLSLPRPRFLVGLALGFFLAAAVLVALLGPSLPALAQSGRGSPTVEPFRAKRSFAPSEDPVFLELDPPVPAGRLLVVEAVFANISVSAGQRAALVLGPEDDEVVLPTAFQGTVGPGTDFYVTSPTTTRLYFPAGPLRFGVVPLGPAAIFASVTVVGHLVPAP